MEAGDGLAPSLLAYETSVLLLDHPATLPVLLYWQREKSIIESLELHFQEYVLGEYRSISLPI